MPQFCLIIEQPIRTEKSKQVKSRNDRSAVFQAFRQVKMSLYRRIIEIVKR